MRVNEVHRLIVEEGDDLDYRFQASPNTSPKPQLPERTLVIHAPGSRTVNGAVSQYINKPKNALEGRSRHLILGRDGREIVQMVPFHIGAMHAFGYNGRSIAIELQYPGQLVNQAPSFDKMNKFNERQYIHGSSLNNSKYAEWALYPKEQLDALLKIAVFLKGQYNITDVVGYEEIAGGAHPGPAFPIIQFREKLLGVTSHSFILQEMARAAQLLGQPGNANSLLSGDMIQSGMPVSVLSEKSDWYLIAVAGEVGGNPWLVGWVEKDAVRVQTNFAVQVDADHYLVTEEGRRFQEITPHQNGYQAARTNEHPKYIIMHFTTGTKMESTISHFKNPASLVSTHLLIGRDGRVVQFLPFHRIAHHSGFSWWERLNNLNNFSIGIELDNAGLLSRTKDGWTGRKVPIPNERVQQAVHWKQFTPNDPAKFPGWEKFTEAQLRVALNIVKAIKARYPSIEEILGHDDVNLRNRYDPGPLFPMEDFRMELFGRKHPRIEVFTLNKKTHLYSNFNGRLPNTSQQLHEAPLPATSKVRVIRQDDDLALVTVVKSKENSLNQKTGWVRINSLAAPPDLAGKKKNEGNQMVTSRAQNFFKRTALPPTPPLDEGLFPEGTRVRIQQVRGEWTLVVLLDRFKGRGGIEGWISTELLSPEVVS